MKRNKPIHVKPSYYAIMFEPLKRISMNYGYNLVLHGSLNRDMDLIAIPWNEELGSVDDMLNEFCDLIFPLKILTVMLSGQNYSFLFPTIYKLIHYYLNEIRQIHMSI